MEANWILFCIFCIALIWSGSEFLADIWSAFGSSPQKEKSATDAESEKLSINEASLNVMLTELNNRTRWYSTELWHVPFAYLGICAVAIGQVIDKKAEWLPYSLAIAAVLGLFVVWHMTRLRRSEQRNIRNLSVIEGNFGVPPKNRAKTNPLPKPFQFAIFLVVLLFALMATLTFTPAKSDSAEEGDKQNTSTELDKAKD